MQRRDRWRRGRTQPWPSPFGHNTRSHRNYRSGCRLRGLKAKARETAVHPDFQGLHFLALSLWCQGLPRLHFPLRPESEAFAACARFPLPSAPCSLWPRQPPCSSGPRGWPRRVGRSILQLALVHRPPGKTFFFRLLSVSLLWQTSFPFPAFRRFQPCSTYSPRSPGPEREVWMERRFKRQSSIFWKRYP